MSRSPDQLAREVPGWDTDYAEVVIERAAFAVEHPAHDPPASLWREHYGRDVTALLAALAELPAQAEAGRLFPVILRYLDDGHSVRPGSTIHQRLRAAAAQPPADQEEA